MTITIQLDERESKALDELTALQERSPEKVMVSALRLYQGVVKGAFRVEETNPGPGCGIIE